MPEVEILVSGFTFNSDQTRMGMSTCTLLRGQKLTVVDVGHFGRRDMLATALKNRGIGVNDVERVILTHAHWDHAQNTDLFPNAEIVIHQKEVEYTHSPKPNDMATARYFARQLDGRNVQLVTKEIELEPGVRLLETPGHTRGHISVLTQTSRGLVCVSGDAMSDAGAIGRGLPALVMWSEDEARASIKKVLAAASTFYPGHDRPFQVAASGEISYLAEAPTIKFFGILDHSGSTFSVEVALAPNRGSTVFPDARSKQS